MRILPIALLVSLQNASGLTFGTNTYSSSATPAITNLTSWYYYDETKTNIPILVCLHGLSGDNSNWTTNAFTNFVASGWFVLPVNMRGRLGASGSKDSSGLEVVDIYDAVVAIRVAVTNASQTVAVFYGISGGGANAWAAACKTPDFYAYYICYSGVIDYGFDPNTSWYQFCTTNEPLLSSYLSVMNTTIGGTPTQVPDSYQARDCRFAIGKNLSGAFVWSWMGNYRTNDDNNVNTINSYLVQSNMVLYSRTNYKVTIDPTGGHVQYPNPTPTLFSEWSGCYTNFAAWTIPASGSLRCVGYLITKRFTVWLGGGTNQVADVDYDASTATFTLTPVTTNGIAAAITESGFISLSTNITSPTTITLTATNVASSTVINSAVLNVGTIQAAP